MSWLRVAGVVALAAALGLEAVAHEAQEAAGESGEAVIAAVRGEGGVDAMGGSLFGGLERRTTNGTDAAEGRALIGAVPGESGTAGATAGALFGDLRRSP